MMVARVAATALAALALAAPVVQAHSRYLPVARARAEVIAYLGRGTIILRCWRHSATAVRCEYETPLVIAGVNERGAWLWGVVRVDLRGPHFYGFA